MVIFDFWKLFADLHYYIGGFFRNLTVFTSCTTNCHLRYQIIGNRACWIHIHGYFWFLRTFCGFTTLFWWIFQEFDSFYSLTYGNVGYQIIGNRACWIHIHGHFLVFENFFADLHHYIGWFFRNFTVFTSCITNCHLRYQILDDLACWI